METYITIAIKTIKNIKTIAIKKELLCVRLVSVLHLILARSEGQRPRHSIFHDIDRIILNKNKYILTICN